MSTPGDTISTPRDTMSTPRGYHEYTRGFWYEWEKPLPNFKDFYSFTFCDYAVVYVGLWNVRQLAKISLSGSQSPDPNTFLVSSLIKSL